VPIFQLADFGDIRRSVGKIPQNMERQGGSAAGEAMDFGSVGKFLFNRRSGCNLSELAEASSGIGEAPRRQFDLELVECIECLTGYRLPKRLIFRL
jgi:hypothetical protein